MKNINGQGNEITIILPHKKIDCISSHHEQFNQIIHQSHIIITGNNNHVSMHFDSEENVEKLLLNEGFLLIIKGNDNTVNLGTIILRYSNILGMSGLKLIIGQLPGLGTGVSIDNIDVGVFNEGYKLHFAVAPQVGIRFINHINVYLQYYVTHKDFSRLVLGVGYVF